MPDRASAVFKNSKPISQGPALAVFKVQEGVGFWQVGDAHGVAIPQDFLASSHSDVAKQDRFGEHTGVIEVGHCDFRFVFLDRAGPFMP